MEHDDDVLRPGDEGKSTEEHLSDDTGERVDAGDDREGETPVVPPHIITPG